MKLSARRGGGATSRRASALLVAALGLAGAGCGGGLGKGPVVPAAPEPPGSRPLAEVLVPEAWGIPPGDTTATVPADRPRTVLMLHGPPDHAVFAELRLPAGALAGGTTPATVTLRARPGLYGVEIGGSGTLAAPAVLVFRYPVHFSAPTDALARYGTPTAFEAALWVARVEDDGTVRFLPSTRPAPDNLVATITSFGTYIVAAPR